MPIIIRKQGQLLLRTQSPLDVTLTAGDGQAVTRGALAARIWSVLPLM